jgi:hypothetical protein
MGQKRGRNAGVVVDDLSLGESGGGVKDLVEIRQGQALAFDVDDGRGAHRTLSFKLGFKMPQSV